MKNRPIVERFNLDLSLCGQKRALIVKLKRGCTIQDATPYTLRSLSIFLESNESARVVHSHDSPAALPVKRGLQVRF